MIIYCLSWYLQMDLITKALFNKHKHILVWKCPKALMSSLMRVTDELHATNGTKQDEKSQRWNDIEIKSNWFHLTMDFTWHI